MKRWLFNLAAGMSISACFVIGCIWITSLFLVTSMTFSGKGHLFSASAGSGTAQILRVDQSGPNPQVFESVGWTFQKSPTTSLYFGSWKPRSYQRKTSFSNGSVVVIRTWDIPIVYLFILAVAPIGMFLVMQQIARRRAPRPGLCDQCGYDLRATPERCPECGAIPTADS